MTTVNTDLRPTGDAGVLQVEAPARTAAALAALVCGGSTPLWSPAWP
ncbi:MAG: hypothetical protein AAF471_06560 [Myxococcota bacterium]